MLKSEQNKAWWAAHPNYQNERRARLRLLKPAIPALDSAGLTLFFVWSLFMTSYRMEKSRLASAKWRKENPGKLRLLIAKWQQNNPERIAAHRKQFIELRRAKAGTTKFIIRRAKTSEEKREEARLKSQAYRKNNPERVKATQKRSKEKYKSKRQAAVNARAKIRRKTDLNFRLAEKYRTRIRQVLKGQKKSAKTLELLGCDIPEFKSHIENQFRSGMTWANRGTVWELDHILPCAAFHLQHSEEQEICFHWTNFQPLLVSENRTKRDKIL